MSYIDLINQFWRMNRIEPFSPYEVYLYFYLLNQCNMRGMENPFSIKTAMLYVELKMSKKVIYDARESLQERGLIDFTEGERRVSAPVYQIMENVEIGRQRRPEKQEESIEEVDEIPIPPYEEPESQRQPKKSKKKEKSLDDLFEIPKPEKRKKKEFVPPTLQEVEDFFSGLGIQDAVDVAQQFFFHYDSLGWHTATGAVVHRWESLANKWLLNDKKKEHENNRSSSKKGGDEYKQTLINRIAEAERKYREENGIV